MPIDQDLKDASAKVERTAIGAPDHRGALLVAKLILMGVAVFAAGEASWRLTGFQPRRSDLLEFDRLYDTAARNSSSAVVLVGSSHVLCDLDPRTLKRELPQWEFYQLAMDGCSALPMLENLAQDTRFHGHVLCEFDISHFMGDYPFRDNDFHQLQYVQFIQRRPYPDFLKTWLFETLGQHSALVAAKDWDFLGAFRGYLAAVVRNRVKSGSPAPSTQQQEAVKREDRFLGLQRRGKDNSRAIAGWARSWAIRAHGNSGVHVASWVEAIRRRGGDVVFVRTPLSGSLRRIEEATYPEQGRAIESLAARNITVIDFAKEPLLSKFECPDESHLDSDDAERYSAILARMIKDRGLLRRVASEVR
jgi:hypothetical protein